MNIVIIPAREGSKRLPNKNLISLDGYPLIVHSIRYAKCCELVDEVWVSTDSKKIANVSKRFGANSLDRPTELADDFTPTHKVISYHVNNFIKEGKKIEWVIILQPTNPIRPPGLITKALIELKNKNKSALACFSPTEKKFGKIQNETFYAESYSLGQRSQDIEDRYFENGLLYIVSAELAKKGKIFPDNLYPYIIKSIHGTVDIDYKEDLEYAEVVLNYLKNN